MHFSWRISLIATIVGTVSTAARAAELPAPLGATGFTPSVEHPVGWRGDGTGRYPGATPPTSWSRQIAGDGYSTKGIVWMAPLPNIGVSCPIIVGDRIFVTSEVSDLVCLDKISGKVLWIRSNAEFEGISAAEQKANPAFAEKLSPLTAELEKVNAGAVDALNAQLAGSMKTQPGEPDAIFKQKRELEKQIEKAQISIDKKRFGRYWGQAVFGFSGATPTSDGKHVCAFFTTGVTACYDVDGHRKWIARGEGNGSEHGNFASPLLCGNRLVVWANEMRGYDVESGALAWSNPAKGYNTYGSLFRLTSGGEMVACFQWGFFARVKDGKPIWDEEPFGDSVATPVVDNGAIFARVGYPKANDQNQGLRAFKIPPSTDAGKIEAAYEFKVDWKDDEIPVDKEKSPFDRGYVSSPLVVNGLVYQLTQGGGLVVNDASNGDLVYRKVLPLKPRTQYWNWAGCSASPTLAGKYIYLMDNQGTTVIIEPGRQYVEVAINKIEELRDNKEQAQNNSTPVFEGKRMYYRTPGYLYCIGE